MTERHEDVKRRLAKDALAEAERTIAWLRSGGGLFHYSRIDTPINYVEVGTHLDSSPPEGWKP